MPEWWEDKGVEPEQVTDFLKTSKDFNAFVKQANEYQRQFGSRIPIPTGESEDQINEFVKKVTPESPEKYELKWSDDIAWQEKQRGDWLALLHKTGVMPWQAQKLVDGYVEIAKSAVADADNQATKDAEAKRIENLTELNKRFNNNPDGARKRATEALQFFGKEGLGNRVQSTLEAAGLQDNPDILEVFGHVREQITEDTWLQGSSRTFMSPDDAKAAQSAMLNDKKHPFNNSAHPDHKAACEEHERLGKIVAGIA